MKYIGLLVLLLGFVGTAQVSQNKVRFEVNGSVRGKENLQPLTGVEINASNGNYALTNTLGEFKIKVAVGDELVISSPLFSTIRYTIKNNEEIQVLVEGYSQRTSSRAESSLSKKSLTAHQMFLDSANYYKRTNIEKSIDFITKSLAQLGSKGNKKELSASYTALGEIYLHYRQYDLAIANFKDAMGMDKTLKTALLLGNAYILNKEFRNAEGVFLSVLKDTNTTPFQKVQIYEGLGDAYRGMGNSGKAVEFYSEGLKIANANLVTPKITDLNSKIADSYAEGNKLAQAQNFYNNSLELASQQTPQRAVQEKEKVADFYNQKNDYGAEIELRKKSLEEIKQLPKAAVPKSTLAPQEDSITAQRINYKIANAYISQDKFDEAIPYLEQSIREADFEDDLVVQKDATRKLSEVYNFKGDFSKALETYQKYVAVVDTLYVRKEQEISRAARFNREIAASQSRISGLEQERQLSQSKYDLALTEQQLIEENSKRQKWAIYSLSFGMLLMGLVIFFFYRSNKQQQLANNLLALKSLRTQMNPHFIFNALNSVNNYIAKSDERSANRYLSDFSTLMRAVLENSEQDFIPLSKELELLELYVKLEHSRFPEKFEYQIQVDEQIDMDGFQIPPMLLQPYIENAIWHGLRYKEDKGFLRIDLRKRDKETVVITILDNGIGRAKSAELKTKNQLKQKSQGMGNIKKRIAILNDMYKDKVAVAISDLENDGSGTKVELHLKKN